MPATVISSLPIPQQIYQGSPRFSLFKKIDNRWHQIRTVSYAPEMACHVWAEFVSLNPKLYSIRKASFDYNEAK